MTARQRQAPGSAAVAVPAQPVHANGSSNGDIAPFRWEEWFASASPDQRAEALALARDQGLLYLQQLPAVEGKTPREGAGQSALGPLIARMLSGKVDALPNLADESIAWSDSQLDALQREAVRRALNTPDLSLLQGLPGTGKSRVVTEVVRQAARRGWRVLLLAPTAAAVNVVLERLAGCSNVLPIRLHSSDEAVEGFPTWLRALTLAEQRRAFRDRSVAGARQARRQAEETCQRRQREESVWPQLPPLAERHTALQERLRVLATRMGDVGGQVEREAASIPSVGKGLPSGPFVAEIVDMHKRSSTALAEWQAAHKTLEEKRSTSRNELNAIAAQLAALGPKCRARQERRWWTLAYWTGASALEQRDALEVRKGKAQSELSNLEQARTALDEERRRIDANAKTEHSELLRGETERRQQQLSSESTELLGDVEQVLASWQSLCAGFEPAELRPAALTAAEITAAQERWHNQRRRDDEGSQFARQWADYLDQAGEQLLPRLPALANLIAGPVAVLTRCSDWGEAATAPFDLLIVEEAETLTESDLHRLAARAPRLLLVGQALAEPQAAAAAPGKPPRSLHGLQAVCWPRLWDALADDLGRLPYFWQRDGDRLVCHLATVRVEDERYLESEGLADAPEIELRILNLPRCRPVLARVSFPSHYTIQQATAFIYREMQELPIQPLGRTSGWEETDDAWVLHLGPIAIATTEAVDLGSGVVMGLVAANADYAGRGARLDFAKKDGWDRPAARRWLETHLHTRDRERAVFLQVPYRMYRGLAEVVGPLLYPETCLAKLLLAQAAAEVPFEFVAVPAQRTAEWPREGAGLEHDLASGRHGDRLPADLRGELPRKGIVNYLEAQALIRRLEQWAQTPAARAGDGTAALSVLVLALYEAQAELVRRLVARSPILRTRPFPLEVAVPGQARQRECDVLVLSLTRSHSHRCVPFGDDIADLAVALTRPRKRLMVFGDLGTLVKRTRWQGPLDQFDASAAHVEGLRVSRLVHHLQSR